MADEITNSVVDGASKVGSGGGLLALGYMIVNIFKKKVEVDDEREAKAMEAMVAEMKISNASISRVESKVDVLTERTSGLVARVDKGEARIEALQLELAEVKGQLKHILENMGR